MTDIHVACERLALSRERVRLALHQDAITPSDAPSPLHVAGEFALDAVDSAVRPVAQRNPWGLVLGAAAAGGVLAWTRPWRWLLTPALLAGVLPQLVSKAVSGAPPLPWLKLLVSATRPTRKTGRPLP